MRWGGASAALSGLLTAGLLVTGPAPAQAACASGVRESPYAFTGTVVGTNRVAVVRAIDGRTVEVRGGSGGVVGEEDRTFAVGKRYRFSPVNGASPYRDNACTTTHLLPSAPRASSPDTSSASPWWRGGSFVADAGVVLLVLTALWLWLRRMSGSPWGGP